MHSPYDSFIARVTQQPEAGFLLAPASAALPYAPDGFAWSYGQTADAVASARARYAKAGYGHGARVGLMLENRPEFIVHWLALNGLGVSIVPLNPDLRPDEITFQLMMGKVELVVSVPERLAQGSQADVAGLRVIEPGDTPPECRQPASRQVAEAADECALLFTSGTTGAPKGCILSNAYFLRLASWYVSQGGIASVADGQEVMLTPLPMFHMNALGCSVVGMIITGGAVVLVDRFHARRWWRTVADSKATIIHYLGVMPAILLQLPEEAAERAHAVRFGFGAGVDARHKRQFESRFGFPLVEGWAMTETGGGSVTSTAKEAGELAPRCIGRPIAEMEWRIVGDDGHDMPLGQPGELLVRSNGNDPRSGFFSGYLGDPEATEQAWAGGWFHTGDVVFQDAGGLLYFFDRKKNVVRRSGENIAVLEVEAALAANDVISAAAVAPVPDEMRGDEVFAFVKLNDAAGEDEAARRAMALRILTDCAQRIAYHKVPGYIAFVDSLPVTSTQKLQRGEIKAQAARCVAEGRALDLRDAKSRLRQG